MGIRVTTPLIIQQNISDVNRNLRILQNIQTTLSTGRQINRPSDDPIGVVSSLRLREGLTTTNQHQTNINDGKGRLSATLTALSSVDNLVLDIQGLAQSALQDPTSAARGITALEIDGLISEMMINANAKYLGKYLFGGHESLTPPYEATFDALGRITDVTRNPDGIDDKIFRTIAEGLDVEVNVSGSAPFMPNGEDGVNDVFDTLIRIRDNLNTGNMAAVQTAYDELNSEFENIIVQASIAGERQARLEGNRKNNEELNIIKEANLSEILNTDYARAIQDLNFQQFILEASLQVGARIIPPSLLDFI